MSGNCFHKGCYSGSHGSSTHLFKLPSSEEYREQWLKNIPKRRDKDFDVARSRICHLHFEQKFIIKENVVQMNGEVIAREPRIHWKLTSDAVPTLFSNDQVPKYFDKQNKKRKSPKKREAVAPKKPKPSIADQDYQASNFMTMMQEQHHRILVPDLNWKSQFHHGPGGKISLHIFELAAISSINQIAINKIIQINEDKSFEIHIGGRDVTKEFNHCIKTLDDLNDLVDQLGKIGVCKGLSEFKMVQRSKLGIRRDDTWFSNNCEIISEIPVCGHCIKLKNALSVAKSRLILSTSPLNRKKSSPSNYSSCKSYAKLKARLNSMKQRVHKLSKLRAQDRVTLKIMQQKFLKIKNQAVEDIIDSCEDLPKNSRMALKTAVLQAKATAMGNKNSKFGFRYQHEWILQCLLLKITSPKAYRYLRQNNILPLPHIGTLHRLIRGIPCQFGFSDYAFEAMEKELLGKSEKWRQGVLTFDEMKIKESIDFKKYDMKFVGFVDFGNVTSEFVKSSQQNQLADHALVFMFRPLNAKWVQPVAAFGTRGAASGEILAKLMISCIIRLEESGARVICITSDGASTNRNMWTRLGISGKPGTDISNKIAHPVDENRQLYFVSDVPHLFKCVRNNMLNKTTVKFAGKNICFNHYKAAYDQDKQSLLRAIPKIKEAHVHPTPFQKMVVSYATQIFSKSMTFALRFYREQGVKDLQGSEETENFTLQMNDLFDSLNSNYGDVGVTRDSLSFKVKIQLFLKKLEGSYDVNTFASATTIEGMRVTLQSTLDIIIYLTKNVGYKYVLTAKLNQVCLERFFGIIRSFAGDDDHPTVCSFSHLSRLLSLFNPISRITRGNIDSSIDENGAMLTTFMDNLRKKRLASANMKQVLKKKIQKSISDHVIDDVVNSLTSEPNLQDHDYAKAPNDRCILFHLCGYMAFKAARFTSCKICQDSLCSSEIPTTPEAKFTNIKTFGFLKYPSRSLFCLIEEIVEPKLTNAFESNCLAGDIVFRVIDSFENIELSKFKIGCGLYDHFECLLSNVLSYYITIRMYFFSRVYNRDHLKTQKKTKNDRKKVKLN